MEITILLNSVSKFLFTPDGRFLRKDVDVKTLSRKSMNVIKKADPLNNFKIYYSTECREMK